MKFHDFFNAELRMEAFNAFNHPQFGAPNMTATSGDFGAIKSQANNARVVQISAHVRF
jgi:hypothetical protein